MAGEAGGGADELAVGDLAVVVGERHGVAPGAGVALEQHVERADHLGTQHCASSTN